METVKYCPVCGFVACFGQWDTCIECHADLIDTGKELDAYYAELNTQTPEIVQEYIRKNCIYNMSDFNIQKENERLKSVQDLETHIKESHNRSEAKIQNNIPKCPTCESSDIEKISGMNKVGSGALFGIFSLGHISKTFKCKNCGYKW